MMGGGGRFDGALALFLVFLRWVPRSCHKGAKPRAAVWGKGRGGRNPGWLLYSFLVLFNRGFSEGEIAGVVPARRVMFRGFTVKFETTFVKPNRKLVHKCGFRFSGRSLEHAEQKPRNLESGPQNLDFREQVETMTLFPGVKPKSEVTFVNQLSILFLKCGLRFWCHPREDHGTS